jgi:hypothetical protein
VFEVVCILHGDIEVGPVGRGVGVYADDEGVEGWEPEVAEKGRMRM